METALECSAEMGSCRRQRQKLYAERYRRVVVKDVDKLVEILVPTPSSRLVKSSLHFQVKSL